MRIAFICGSLEEGCDGVGDYVLRLARFLQSQDIQCLCIAIADKYVNSTLESTVFNRQGDPINCTRISTNERWSVKQSFLQQSLDSFNPDWISLHYIPYAFHSKGLPYRLRLCLGSLVVAAQWHVMIHELWVDPCLRLSNRVLAPIQILLLKNLIISLGAKVIHTSNFYYQELLGSISLNSLILPMFGSVRRISVSSSPRPYLGRRFVLFGGILPDWEPGPLLSAIIAVAQQQSILSLEFLSIGIAGAHGSKLWSSLAATAPAGVAYKILGSLPADEISYWLQHSDFGITTSPSHLIGKSSTVAAMIEHGLPVIVSRLEKTNGPWHQILKTDQRFVLFDQDFSETFTLTRKLTRKFPAKDQLSDTAHSFIQSLVKAK
jgi:hypothetical protein